MFVRLLLLRQIHVSLSWMEQYSKMEHMRILYVDFPRYISKILAY